MAWEFFNPVRIVAGAGTSRQLAKHLPPGHYLLLTTAGMVRRGGVAAITGDAGETYRWTVDTCAPNPQLDALELQCSTLRKNEYDGIVALGGGSVIDTAKVLSAVLRNSDTQALSKHLRHGEALDFSRCLPLACMPTTAGTGADVTPFATVWDRSAKFSLMHTALYPRLTLLDPELTRTLPEQETLHGALDASSHALETLWNVNTIPLAGTLAVQALEKICANLQGVLDDPDDLEKREALQVASLYAGLAISQNRTAIAHSISYPLTARYGVPHGLACSFTLAALLELVARESAWSFPVPASLLLRLKTMFASLSLGKQVRAYCSDEQVLGLIPEMFNPQRAANFTISISPAQVREILDASLNS